eukprot:1801297-Prymnesium_polylepis.1
MDKPEEIPHRRVRNVGGARKEEKLVQQQAIHSIIAVRQQAGHLFIFGGGSGDWEGQWRIGYDLPGAK